MPPPLFLAVSYQQVLRPPHNKDYPPRTEEPGIIQGSNRNLGIKMRTDRHNHRLQKIGTYLASGGLRCCDRKRATLPHEHTRILQMAYMNAQSALMRSAETPKYGLVEHVGLSSISDVSRNGQRMKDLPLRDRLKRFKEISQCPQSNGGAQDAIYPKIPCLPHTLVGVKRT